jgi:hypothetical protein
VQEPKSIAVAGAIPNMNWKLARDTTSIAWKLVDAKPGEELDAPKASGVANLFASASFADVLDPKTAPADAGLDKPSTVRIETFDGFAYDLRVGKLMAENYPVLVTVSAQLAEQRVSGQDEKPEDKASLDQQFETKHKELAEKLAKEKKVQNWIFLMPKATIDQVLKDRSGLFVEKKPSPSPTAAAAPGKAPSPPVAAPSKAKAPSPPASATPRRPK